MKIGGSSTLDEINAGAWAAFALEAAIGLPLIRRRVAEISEAVKDQAESVATELIHAGLDGTFLARIARLAVDRAGRCGLTVGKGSR